MSCNQRELSSPVEFLSKLLEDRINEDSGCVTQRTIAEYRRQQLFMEFINSELEYLDMLRIFYNTYMSFLSKTDYTSVQMVYQVVGELISGEERLVDGFFGWLGVDKKGSVYGKDGSLQFNVKGINEKFRSIPSLTSFIELFCSKLLEMEPHYKSYVYHYWLFNSFKNEGTMGSKYLKDLCRMEPMLKQFQQQRVNCQSTDFLKRNISFDSLRHMPIARLGHYKVFCDCILHSAEELIADDGKEVEYTGLDLFRLNIQAIHQMLRRIDGEVFSESIDRLGQNISQKIAFKNPEEYVSPMALGIPQLVGVLNTIWIEVDASQRLWNNTIGSLDTWSRSRSFYPAFLPKAKQFGAFLYKSYLILTRIPIGDIRLQNQFEGISSEGDNATWKIKFAIPLTNCKISIISRNDTCFSEIGIHKETLTNVKLLKLEWFLYGDIFETIFVFECNEEYNKWSNSLSAILELNGYTQNPIEAECVEHYYQVPNSSFAPLGIAPKHSYADNISKVVNPNLTKRQYNLLHHSIYEYYNQRCFRLKIKFEDLKTGPTIQKDVIVFARQKYNYLQEILAKLLSSSNLRAGNFCSTSPRKLNSNSISNSNVSMTTTQTSLSQTSVRSSVGIKSSWFYLTSHFRTVDTLKAS